MAKNAYWTDLFIELQIEVKSVLKQLIDIKVNVTKNVHKNYSSPPLNLWELDELVEIHANSFWAAILKVLLIHGSDK